MGPPLLLLFTIAFTATTAKKLPPIYWNSTNPSVESCANTDDIVDIKCPYYDVREGKGSLEQSVVYRVSKEEYDECRLGDHAKEVGRCADPRVQTNLKIAFRSFTANKFALTYKPGTYYFISTSTGTLDGLGNRIGGLCTTHALKMKVHVLSRGESCQDHLDYLHEKKRHRHHHKHKPAAPSTTTTVYSTDAIRVPEYIPREHFTDGGSRGPPPIVFPDNGLPAEDNQLWEHFYQKVDNEEEKRHSPTRGERVALDTKTAEYKLADMYEALAQQLDREVQFEIHEIGEDPDSIPYRSAAAGSSLIVVVIGLILLTIFVARR